MRISVFFVCVVVAGLAPAAVQAQLAVGDIVVVESIGSDIHVVRVDSDTGTGESIASFTPASSTAVGFDVAIGGPNTVFIRVADAATSDNSVYKVDLQAGTAIELSVLPIWPPFTFPHLALDVDGNVLVNVVDNGVDTLLRVDATTGAQSVLSTDPLLYDLGDITVRPDGDIFVMNNTGAATTSDIVLVDPVTGAASVAASPIDGTAFLIADHPRGTLLGTSGTILLEWAPPAGPFPRSLTVNPFWQVALERTGTQTSDLLVPLAGALYRRDISGFLGSEPLVFLYAGAGSVSAVAVRHPACSDGLDNDGDGVADFPNEVGCANALDDNEGVNPPGCSNSIVSPQADLAVWCGVLLALAFVRRTRQV